VLQTFVPDHYAVAPVRSHDYERFYARELASRAALGYPPFGHLAYALVSGPDETAARDCAGDLAARARARAGDAEVLGPVPAPLTRLRGRFRFQILAKAPDAAGVRDVARVLAEGAARLRAPLAAHVDLQPVNML